MDNSWEENSSNKGKHHTHHYPKMSLIGRWRISSMSSMVSTLTGRLPCRASMVLILCCSLRRCRDGPLILGRLDRPSSIARSISVPLVRLYSGASCNACWPDCSISGRKKSVICLCRCLSLSDPLPLKRPSLCLRSSSKYNPRHL